jgi:hypothetical protein
MCDRIIAEWAHNHLAGIPSTESNVTFPALLTVVIEPLIQGKAMATAPQLTSTLPSAQEWRDRLEEILPLQGEWSEQEYLVLTDHRSRLIEFTDGFLDVLPTPTDKHQAIQG